MAGIIGGVSGLYARRSLDLGVTWSTEVEISAGPGEVLRNKDVPGSIRMFKVRTP